MLLLDGEQVIGGKENRIFNANFVVLLEQTVQVPVSCVEQGRWAQAAHFSTSGATLHRDARKAKLTAKPSCTASVGRRRSTAARQSSLLGLGARSPAVW